MEVFKLMATIGLDASEYEQGLQKARQRATQVKAPIEQIGKSAQKSGEQVANTAPSLEKLATSTQKSGDAADKAVKPLDKVGISSEKSGEHAKKATTQHEKLTSVLDKVGIASKDVSAEEQVLMAQLQKAESEVKQLSAALTDSVKKTGAQSDAAQELQSELRDAKERVSAIKNELKNYSAQTEAARAVTSRFAYDLGGMAQIIKTGVSVAVTAGITALGAFGKIGLDYNGQMEGYTTNFAVMMGSQADAVAKVEELRKMAAATPFGMTDLADATQTLMQFQVPAEKAVGILQMLGDVAMGDSAKLSGLALVFGQVSSAGKLQGQDLMQMINQGFNPLNYIAKRTGENMEELRERMSAGAISAAEVKQAFRDATNEGGQFYNGMQQASKTSAGLSSTLRDVVATKAGEFFGGVSEKIKEMLPQLIKFVESIDVADTLANLKELGQKFIDLAPLVVTATTALTGFRVAVTVTSLVAAATEKIKELGGAISILKGLLSAAGGPIGIVLTLIAAAVAALVTLWMTNEDFRNTVINVWEQVKSGVSAAIEALVQFFTITVPQALGMMLEFFRALPGSIVVFLARVAADASVWASNLTLQALELGANFLNGVISFFQQLPEQIGYFIGMVLANIVNWVATMVARALELGANFLNALVNFFSQLPGNIANFINQTLANVVAWATDMRNKAVETGTQFLQKIVAFFTELPGKVNEWLIQTLEKVVAWGGEMMQKGGEAAKKLLDAVVDGVAGLPDTLFEQGKRAAQSLLDGIVSMGAWLSEKIGEFVGGIINGFTSNIDVDVGSSARADGSHASGLRYVPFDGYLAKLHEGEMVLTRAEANQMRQNSNGGTTVVQNIYSSAKSAADLMREARWQQERAVLYGV